MRTLKLTHEQIELIRQALGLAEQRLTDIHTEICKTTLVRGCKKMTIDYRYHKQSTDSADLNNAIGGGDLDV